MWYWVCGCAGCFAGLLLGTMIAAGRISDLEDELRESRLGDRLWTNW